MIHSNQKIRMYNNVTYTVEEILNLWAGRTVHCGHLIVGIEEMVELTLRHGAFNPSDLGGHRWGLSMELVEEPELEPRDKELEEELVADMKRIFWAHTACSRGLEAYWDFQAEYGEWHQALEACIDDLESYLSSVKLPDIIEEWLQYHFSRGVRKLEKWYKLDGIDRDAGD